MTDQLRTLGLRLYDIGCFQDKKQSPGGKGFKLKLHEKNPDAPLSPFYLNLRTPDNPKPGPLTRELVEVIGDLIWEEAELKNCEFDFVLGVPRAGDPLAAAVSDFSGARLLRLNKEESASARRIGGALNGEWTAGEPVLVVDDLITRADSKLEAIDVLESHGLVVELVSVIVDREQGGKEELRKRGYDLVSLFSLTDLLDLYVRERRMASTERDEILSYIRETATA